MAGGCKKVIIIDEVLFEDSSKFKLAIIGGLCGSRSGKTKEIEESSDDIGIIRDLDEELESSDMMYDMMEKLIESMRTEFSSDYLTGRYEGSDKFGGESVVEIMKRRCRYSDEELLSLIGEEQRYARSSDKYKKKLVSKLRLYMESVIKSQGFECTHFPGPILNLTTVEPRDELIYKMNRYEECYSHLKRMAKSAIDSYNKDAGTRFRVKSIENVTLWKIRSVYYITFTGLDVHDDYKEQRFQSIVLDRITKSNKMEEYSDKSVKSMDEEISENYMEKRSDKSVEGDEWSNKLIEEVPSSFCILLLREIGAGHENNVCEEELDGAESDEENSSDEYDSYETSNEDGDDSDDGDLGSVDIFSSIDRTRITDAELLSWMSEDSRSLEVKTKLLPKVRSYLKSIAESEGFDCTHFPGHVSGVTTVEPRQIVIDKRDGYPEGYRHIMFLSSLAITDYNKKFGTKYQVAVIKKVNVRVAYTCTYYITFGAWHPTSNEEHIFQAKVSDNLRVVQQEVLSCRPTLPALYPKFCVRTPIPKFRISLKKKTVLPPSEELNALETNSVTNYTPEAVKFASREKPVKVSQLISGNVVVSGELITVVHPAGNGSSSNGV
ncbi:hypothetical protein OROMI_017831 [Orobanche minor]